MRGDANFDIVCPIRYVLWKNLFTTRLLAAMLSCMVI